MVRPLIFRSLRTVRLQVSFCRHLFRFPWGVQRRATLYSELGACGGHGRAVFLDGLLYYRHPSSFEQLFVREDDSPVDVEDASTAFGFEDFEASSSQRTLRT